MINYKLVCTKIIISGRNAKTIAQTYEKVLSLCVYKNLTHAKVI